MMRTLGVFSARQWRGDVGDGPTAVAEDLQLPMIRPGVSIYQ
jgi:hypothetical protein